MAANVRWLKKFACAGVLLMVISPLWGQEREQGWSFDGDTVGKLPEGWTSAFTGKEGGNVWQVATDDAAPSGKQVLVQVSSEGPSNHFNICVAEGTSYLDLELSVSLKAVSGKIDQGGGVVWRYRDANNYYVARHNPLEDNFRVYKVVEGKRMQLASADVVVPAGRWYRLGITQRGKKIECSLDGKKQLEVEDGTFYEAGQVGVWSKADAATYFDDVQVKPRRE